MGILTVYAPKLPILLGIIGIICGIAIVILSLLSRFLPRHLKAWSSLAIAASIVSIIDAGGLFIGLIISVISSVLMLKNAAYYYAQRENAKAPPRPQETAVEEGTNIGYESQLPGASPRFFTPFVDYWIIRNFYALDFEQDGLLMLNIIHTNVPIALIAAGLISFVISFAVSPAYMQWQLATLLLYIFFFIALLYRRKSFRTAINVVKSFSGLSKDELLRKYPGSITLAYNNIKKITIKYGNWLGLRIIVETSTKKYKFSTSLLNKNSLNYMFLHIQNQAKQKIFPPSKINIVIGK